MCMKPNLLNTLLKKPDGFSKYLKLLINHRGQKLEHFYRNTEKKLVTTIFF